MNKRFIFGVLLLSVSITPLSCFSVPHLFWPQKDIQPQELHLPSLGQKVLIASRSSEFKDASRGKQITGYLAARP
jgi:hypothetical protein